LHGRRRTVWAGTTGQFGGISQRNSATAHHTPALVIPSHIDGERAVNLLLIDTSLYGLSLLLEFAALIALRIREPNLPRPYKVPGGLLGCILISLGPVPIMCLAFYKYLSEDGARNALIAAAIAVVAGVILYFVAVGINPRAAGNVTKPRSLTAK
jgi:amino acid transporter